MIRVLLVDDHRLVQAGLQRLLDAAKDLEVVAVANNGEEGVAIAREQKPDVVLMDLSMPGIGGIEATRRIVESDPNIKVVVLTAHSDKERILDALDAGAVGYLLKDVEPAELVQGLRATVKGESPLHPRAAKALLEARTATRPAHHLTKREQEVLALITEGLANKQVARRLGISEKTVKTHLTRIYQQLDVSDRTQAALWAERHKFVR